MPYRVSGDNDFHEGWLAHMLGEPDDEARPDGWRIGWETGHDTPSVALVAMTNRRARELGQVVVTPDPMP